MINAEGYGYYIILTLSWLIMLIIMCTITFGDRKKRQNIKIISLLLIYLMTVCLIRSATSGLVFFPAMISRSLFPFNVMFFK